MLRYRRKLEANLAHTHITRIRVRDAAYLRLNLQTDGTGLTGMGGELTSSVGVRAWRDGMRERDWAVKRPMKACYGRGGGTACRYGSARRAAAWPSVRAATGDPRRAAGQGRGGGHARAGHTRGFGHSNLSWRRAEAPTEPSEGPPHLTDVP